MPQAEGPIDWLPANPLPALLRSKVAQFADLAQKTETLKLQSALLRASNVMSSSLDYVTALQNMAKLVVPELGDWCALDMASPGGEKKFAAIFERASIATCLVRQATLQIADVNPAWLALFGYSREQVIGKTGVELGMEPTGEGRQRLQADGRNLIISNSLDTFELDGERYVLGTFADVTAQRAGETSLQERELQFRELIENLPLLAWSARADGFIDFYNQR